MKIQNFKVRILSAYTGEEVENLGPNSSIYLEITKNLNKNNLVFSKILIKIFEKKRLKEIKSYIY